MKNILLLLALLLSGACVIQAASYDEANTLYAQGDYKQAAQLYQACIDLYPTAEAYYNLGNAYFKMGELSRSILSYERCLRLEPGMKDARHNLRFAEAMIQDNIEDHSSFFLMTWLLTIRNALSEQTWIILSIAAFILLMACVLLFAFMSEPAVRKLAFAIGLMALLVSGSGMANAAGLHRRDTLREEAIITQGIVNAKSSPDRSGTDLFTLHEGCKVRIQEQLGDWSRISVGNYVGWILTSNLEQI